MGNKLNRNRRLPTFVGAGEETLDLEVIEDFCRPAIVHCGA
jgi:hypothetical protein